MKTKVDWRDTALSALLLGAAGALSLLGCAFLGAIARLAWWAVELGWNVL